MAATFVVEDGTGLANANAYVSTAVADQYHENYGNPASWASAATADKENAIREATRYLDSKYVNRWKGYRANADQKLDWPRIDVYDDSGWIVDSDSVPAEIEEACAIAALSVIDGEDLLPDVTGENTNIKKESVAIEDGVSEAKEYFGPKSNFTRRSKVEAALRPLINRGNQRVRA